MIGPVHRITSEVGTKYIEKDHFQTREDEDDKARELKFLPTGAEFQGAVRKFHDLRADGIMNTLLRQTSALSGDEKTKNIPEGKQDQKDTTDHINKNIQALQQKLKVLQEKIEGPKTTQRKSQRTTLTDRKKTTIRTTVGSTVFKLLVGSAEMAGLVVYLYFKAEFEAPKDTLAVPRDAHSAWMMMPPKVKTHG